MAGAGVSAAALLMDEGGEPGGGPKPTSSAPETPTTRPSSPSAPAPTTTPVSSPTGTKGR